MTDRTDPSQLTLPLDDFLVRGQNPGIPRASRVFCNRNLKMSAITWVGFDMDYTLAIYDQLAMDRLSIDATVKKLVERAFAGTPEVVDRLEPLEERLLGLLEDRAREK